MQETPCWMRNKEPRWPPRWPRRKASTWACTKTRLHASAAGTCQEPILWNPGEWNGTAAEGTATASPSCFPCTEAYPRKKSSPGCFPPRASSSRLTTRPLTSPPFITARASALNAPSTRKTRPPHGRRPSSAAIRKRPPMPPCRRRRRRARLKPWQKPLVQPLRPMDIFF